MPSVLVRVEKPRIEKADARVAEIRPIALGFHAKHPLVGLPTVADLAADETSGPRAAAVSEVKAKPSTKFRQLLLWPQPPLAPM